MLIESPTYIVKLTSGCNFACDYCYYLAPKSRKRGSLLSETMPFSRLLAILENICDLSYSNKEIIFHGGEPLLFGKRKLERALKHVYSKDCHNKVTFFIQTNAYNIDEEWIRIFKEYDIKVGISLDGPAYIHNRHRVTVRGEPTFERVLRAAQLLHQSGVKFGVLTVVTKEMAHAAQEVFDFFFEGEWGDMFYSIDFLPSKTVDPKTGRYDLSLSLSLDEWYEFMSTFFDLWWTKNNPNIQVRYFISLIKVLLGGEPEICDLRPDCGRFITIEPNGDIYPCDNLSPFNGMRIGNFDELGSLDLNSNQKFMAFLEKLTMANTICSLTCEWYDVCQGGCLEEKFVVDPSLSSPGYYCEPRKKFFSHVFEAVKHLVSTLGGDEMSG